jgi:hypothetical protein
MASSRDEPQVVLRLAAPHNPPLHAQARNQSRLLLLRALSKYGQGAFPEAPIGRVDVSEIRPLRWHFVWNVQDVQNEAFAQEIHPICRVHGGGRSRLRALCKHQPFVRFEVAKLGVS